MKPINDQKKYIGKYKIVDEIGEGGMGVVYKGVDPYIGRDLAIKTFRLDSVIGTKDFEKRKKQIIKEAKLAGNLKHPNIVTVYDVGEDSGLFYIAMEHVEGQSLRDLIDSNKRFSLEEVKNLMNQVCDALSYAHKKNVIHCDIKPENIILDKNNRVVIVDFGIAIMSTATITNTQNFLGTPSYMSPEHLRGVNPDARFDIFSIGAVLYEIVTGHMAYSGNNITTVIQKVMNDEPPKPTSINPDLPQAFDYIIAKATVKNPENRYQSCEELLNDIINVSIHKDAKFIRKIISRDLRDTVDYDKISKTKRLNFSKPILFSVIALIVLIFSLSLYFAKKQLNQSNVSNRVEHDNVSEQGAYKDSKLLHEKNESNEKTGMGLITKDKKISGQASQQIAEVPLQNKPVLKPEISDEINKNKVITGTQVQKNKQPENRKESFAIYFNNGKKYFDEKMYDKAINEFKIALTIDPNHKEAKKYLELTEIEIQKIENLKQRKALLAERFNKGKKYYEEGKLEEAVIEFKGALSIDPNHKEARNYLELTNIKIEKLKQIEKEEEKKKKITEYSSYGVRSFKEGNFSQAIFYLEEVLKIDPEHKEAKKYLELAKIKKFDEKIDLEDSVDNGKKEDAKLPEGF